MDWLTFISNIVGSIAWPAGACVIALIFRAQLSTLMNNLSKLKWKDIEAEFGEKVDQIREEVREVEDDPNFRDEPIEPRLVELVEAHPHLAVLEAWKKLENAMIDLSVRKLGTDRKKTLNSHLDALVKADIVPMPMAKAIEDIRQVRNQAVHEIDSQISKGRAYLLLDTIADIVGFLSRVN